MALWPTFNQLYSLCDVELKFSSTTVNTDAIAPWPQSLHHMFSIKNLRWLLFFTTSQHKAWALKKETCTDSHIYNSHKQHETSPPIYYHPRPVVNKTTYNIVNEIFKSRSFEHFLWSPLVQMANIAWLPQMYFELQLDLWCQREEAEWRYPCGAELLADRHVLDTVVTLSSDNNPLT